MSSPFHTEIQPTLIDAAGLAALQEAIDSTELRHVLTAAQRSTLRRTFLAALQRRTDPMQPSTPTGDL